MTAIKHFVLLILALLALPTAAFALDVVTKGDISYVSGGIGDEERAELDVMKKQFNLEIFNAYKDGAYVGTAHITITNPKGEDVLVVDAGPIFMAKLPAGSYTLKVAADDNAEPKSKKVSLTSGGYREVGFYW